MNFRSEAQIRDAVEAGFASKQLPVRLVCASQWEQRIVAQHARCVQYSGMVTQSDPETQVYEVYVEYDPTADPTA